jgi:hypothetical protein
MNEAIDLEEAISNVWAVKEDIELLIWRFVDHPERMTEDEIWNHLAGIVSNFDLKCEKLWDTYCKKFELDHYASEERKAYRTAWLKEFNQHLEKSRKAAEKAQKKAKKK